MKIIDLLLKNNKIPIVSKNTILKETLDKMNYYRLGVACIVDRNNKLLGIFTDGDLRRKLLNVQKPWSALLSDDTIKYSTKKPLTIRVNSTVNNALKIMEKKGILDLPVLDNKDKLIGILHLHPALKPLIKNNGQK